MKPNLNHERVILAKEIMQPRIATLSPEASIPLAIQTLLTRKFSGMPIVNDEGDYVGMFSEKCCMKVLATLVENIDEPWRKVPKAHEVMVPREKLFTLSPETDVFAAIQSLLESKHSGAPVIDSDGKFLGVFSEKTCMTVTIETAYNGLPTSEVRRFIDTDKNRLIDADMDLHTISKIFIETPYRRLPVMRGNELVGQISRSDVLKDSRILSCIMKHFLEESADESQIMSTESMIIMNAHEMMQEDSVSAYADEDAKTVSPELDLFSIAQHFQRTPYRRFPVLQNNKLVGQISRCDLLRAAFGLLDKKSSEKRESVPLYLSAKEATPSQSW